MGNLASLLISMAIPYASDLARGTAATLAAIISASATITSAQLACALGSYKDFLKDRESVLRALRNKLRAAFGEKNDYDHLSIAPQTLDLESGVDLVLVSAARYTTEEALRLVQENGLRNIQVTALYQNAELAPLLDGASQGLSAEPSLAINYAVGEDQFERRLNPCVMQALDILGYDEADIKAINDHIIGYKTLVGSPAINHAVLREKGLDEETLTRIESLLPFVDHLRLAFTPWVIGVEQCANLSGLSQEKVKNPHFDLLHALGFSSQEISVANAFCCGHRCVRNVMELDPKHAAIFETAGEIKPQAYLHMAGAVQPFISGDTALSLVVPASLSADLRGEIIIKAWTLGLKSLTLETDTPYKTQVQEKHLMRRSSTSTVASRDPGLAVPTSPRAIKPKAPSRSVMLRSSDQSKPSLRSKRS
jgi:ribonucleoside-diphosphate reductase alpha chain